MIHTVITTCPSSQRLTLPSPCYSVWKWLKISNWTRAPRISIALLQQQWNLSHWEARHIRQEFLALPLVHVSPHKRLPYINKRAWMWQKIQLKEQKTWPHHRKKTGLFGLMAEHGLQGSLLWRKTRHLFLPIVSITFLKTSGTLFTWQAGKTLSAAKPIFIGTSCNQWNWPFSDIFSPLNIKEI